MGKKAAFVRLSVLSCSAQALLTEGTKVRVRLDQTILSAMAVEGRSWTLQ
jgi:hypothetical protein